MTSKQLQSPLPNQTRWLLGGTAGIAGAAVVFLLMTSSADEPEHLDAPDRLNTAPKVDTPHEVEPAKANRSSVAVSANPEQATTQSDVLVKIADLPKEAAQTLRFVNGRLRYLGRPPLEGAIAEDLIDDFVAQAKAARERRLRTIREWRAAGKAKAEADTAPVKMAIIRKEPVPWDRMRNDPPMEDTLHYSFAIKDKMYDYRINPTGEFSHHGQAISAARNAELFLLDSTFRLMFEEPIN